MSSYDPQYPEEPGYPQPPMPPDRSEASSKKLAAGICAIVLAGLGIHKFILGYNTAGITMLVVTIACSTVGACLFFPVLGAVAMCGISIAEGIIYLTKSDEEFYQTYMVRRREWF